VPGFKRAPLGPGPLSDLLDALHHLHLVAGHPSARELQRDIGGRDAPSHAAIHKAFTAGRLPTWRLVGPLVQALARRANRDEQAEVERIRLLWAKAAGQGERLAEPQTDEPEALSQGQISTIGFSRPIFDTLPDALSEIEAVGARKATGAFRIPTGLDDLDALLGGWSQGYLIVVGGRPSSGKTNLLLHFCRAASAGHRLTTMFVTGEMNSREIQMRLLSAQTRVPLLNLRSGHMNDNDRGLLAHEIGLMSGYPIHLATQPEFEMEQLISDASRLIREVGLKLLLIDSLQWMVEGEVSSRNAEAILRRLKRFAETEKISIIVSAHAGTHAGHSPMDVFTSSAAIEQAADVVILLDRLDQDEPESPYAGEANLIVAKNRNGPTATVEVACLLYCCRFITMVSGHVSSPVEETPELVQLRSSLAVILERYGIKAFTVRLGNSSRERKYVVTVPPDDTQAMTSDIMVDLEEQLIANGYDTEEFMFIG
jgi:KaiC/GvpD/RAD55 family RecA-like ATPase